MELRGEIYMPLEFQSALLRKERRNAPACFDKALRFQSALLRKERLYHSDKDSTLASFNPRSYARSDFGL